jgi:hypothetical protein
VWDILPQRRKDAKEVDLVELNFFRVFLCAFAPLRETSGGMPRTFSVARHVVT